MPEQNIESLSSGSRTPSFLIGVTIERKDGKGIFDLFSNQSMGKGNELLTEIKIVQSIFNPYISGYIELYDKGDWIGELNITGFETITLKFGADAESQKTKEVKARIYEIKLINDLARSPKINVIEKANLYRLEFISEQIFDSQFTENFLKNKDFVGVISKSTESNSKIKGLINEISDKYNLKPIEIQETQNGVWIKKDEISISVSNEKGQFEIVHLLNYVTNYAISPENPYAVNFFFWQDTDGWHFKSIEKLINEQKDKSDDELTYFVLGTEDEVDPKRVRSMVVNNQYNSLSLLNDKTLTSFYKKIEPDFSNPYSVFLSSSDGFTYSIVDYDYHRDFNKVSHIESNKLVSESLNTRLSDLDVSSSNSRIYDDLSSFYDFKKYNTPFQHWMQQSAERGFGARPDQTATIWWDYLGRTADSRWSNVTWQSQFDICDLDFLKFNDIYTKIREPLKIKRELFTHKKNIKRKWEAYRCAVCCLGSSNYGGTGDIKLLNEFRDTSGITFNILFGATGIFSDVGTEYKIAAAGSFTDAVNYDIRDTKSENGLTLSYDFTKEPYNKTIGEFYNIKEEIPNFVKYSLEQSIALYDQAISFYDKRIQIIQSFLDNADDYISSANSYISQNTKNSEETSGLIDPTTGPTLQTTWNGPKEFPFNPEPPVFYAPWMNGTPFPYRQLREGTSLSGFNYVDGLEYIYDDNLKIIDIKNKPTKPIPDFVSRCSKDKYMPGKAHIVRNLDTFRLTNYGSTTNQTSDQVFFIEPLKYNISTSGILEGLYYNQMSNDPYSVPDGIESQYEEASNSLRQCIDDGNCFNTLCFEPLIIEIQKRIGEQEIQIVKFERDLYVYLRDLAQNTFIPKWKEMYSEWWNRKAFFISKPVGTSIFTGITGGRQNKLIQPLSLQNIKSIKRKEIKGSRYEILAKSKLGITGASAGQWLYDIYFANNAENNPNGYKPENGKTWWEQDNNHPYYSQGYDTRYGKSAFVTKRKLNNWYEYYDANPLNNKPWQTDDVLPLSNRQQKQTAFVIATEQQIEDLDLSISNLGYALTHLESMQPIVEDDFINAFNIFDENISEKKPPNIKKEELSSYVRIEFISPLGLDRIADFPDGFIRDSGSEYFLPYLVQLTAGPNGRQTVRNNIAIIGMDPYGFDVAIKKQKIENRYEAREYSWWNKYSPINFGSDLSDAGMDLWPEQGFNVETPYYTTDIETSIPQIKDGYSFEYYYWERGGPNSKNPGFESKGIDSQYKQTALGSGYLMSSHKKIKPHRSWWSFYIPTNLFVKNKLFNPSLGYASGALNQFSFNNFYGYNSDAWFGLGSYRGPLLDYSVSNNTNNYGYWYNTNTNDQSSTNNNRFDSRWIELNYGEDTIQLLNNYDLNGKFIKNRAIDGESENILPHTDTSIEERYPELKQYFGNDILHWLSADYALYRPGLVTEDLWKYDLSGETDYGIITPPINEPNYDLFDQNFAAQFMVYAKTNNLCNKFTCANPLGITDSSGCSEDNPYCNCPAQDHMPIEPEPTYLELYSLYNEIRECDLIEENLGKDYLGCIWSDPNNPCSCNCPEIGKKFAEYLKYTRTYATFWGTPNHVPLHRMSLMNQLSSQQMSITVAATDTVKIGDIIRIYHENPQTPTLYLNKEKVLSGKWMVIGMNYKFLKETVQYLELVLTRDTLPVSPDIGISPITAYMI